MDILSQIQFIGHLFGEFWPWFVLIAAVSAAYIYGGQKLASIVGVTGLAIGLYLKGRRDEKVRLEADNHRIKQEREKAYDQIDARNSSASDVAERLRKRSF